MKLKDKKIEVLRPTTVKDTAGFGTQILMPIAPPLWAYFRHLSGRELYANSTAVPTEQVLFTINWRADITTSHVIRYRDVLYDITRIDTFEGYKADITLFCNLRG